MRFQRFVHIIFTAITLSSLILAGCSSDGIFSETTSIPTDTNPPTHTARMLPDLEIVEISTEMQKNKICEPNQERVNIKVVIQNSGDSSADGFSVRMNDNEKDFENRLPPGEKTGLWFPGAEKVLVEIDISNQVEEINEDNNSIEKELELPVYPSHCFQTPTPELNILNPSQTLAGHTAQVLSIDFSPDGNLIASGSIDNTVRIWDVRNAQLVRTMLGHPFPILSIKFSPNGSFLATGSTDGIGRIWRVSNGYLIGTLEGHAGWLNNLDISNDGRLIATCADDYTVRLWRFLDAKEIQTIDEGMSIVSKVIFTPDGIALAWSESNGNVRVRSLEGEWLHLLNESNPPASSLAVAPEGDLLVSGHADGSLRIWGLDNGQLLHEVSGHTDQITSMSFSPDGNWLVSGSADGKPRIWDFTKNRKEPAAIYILSGHEGSVNSVSFSPDGELIATGSDDGTIRLWEFPVE